MFEKYFGGDSKEKAFRWVASALFFLSIFLVLESLAVIKKLPEIGNEIYPQSTIQVSGSGEAYAVPDIATFNFSADETGASVDEAQKKADKIINGALAVVREAGVEEKDIKTTGYNVYPKYEYLSAVCPKPDIYSAYSSVSYCPPGKQVLAGYQVYQSITVKVRDTTKAGELVTAIGETGVSNISGLSFEVDNRDEFAEKARQEAINEAKANAKKLAKQLGVRLGKIVYYSENGYYPVYDAMGKGGAEMSVSSVAPRVAELPTGETKITSNVTITYEIK